MSDPAQPIAPHSSYLSFLRAEHEEILKLKWVESERVGHDIGMDYAVWIWSMKHRGPWISGLKAAGLYPSPHGPTGS